jgi:uncharacterized protein (TIGR02145 family)
VVSSADGGATITISGAVGTYPAGSISVQAKNSFCSSSPRNSEAEIVIGAVPATPGPITFSNTTICGVDTTFTAGVTPVAGATSYKWTLPNGLSFDGASDGATITIRGDIAGTYPNGSISVRAVIASCDGATSTSTHAVTVGAFPAAPIGGNVSNSGTTFTFSATPAPNCTIDWYDSAAGGTKVATDASSYFTTISGTTSYYAESRNTSTGCVSDSRLEVRAELVPRVASGCDLTHSYGGSIITNSANVRFINGDTYTRNGITLSAPVKIVGRVPRTSLASTNAPLVDYRDHRNGSDTNGSWFTWCMVATHADILCPSPWRVPTREDFCQYANNSPTNTSSTSEVKPGIDGWLLAGYASGDDSELHIGTYGSYWSSTELSLSRGYYGWLTSSDFRPSGSYNRYYGFSLRCVK